MNRISRTVMRIPFRNRWYQRGLLLWLLAWGIFAFRLGGTAGIAAGAVLMFLAGSVFEGIIMTEPWRKIAEGWEALYRNMERLHRLERRFGRFQGPS